MQIKSKEIKLVDIDSLVPNPDNNNRHSIEQLERLSKIIKHNGFRNPLIVSNRSGFMIAGHGRLEAAKKLGFKEVPVVFQDFKNEAEEYQYMTADNEIARWAELDKHAVYTKLEALPEIDIDLLGIEDFEIEVEKVEPQADEDDVPEVKHEPVTKRGDVWLLGKHRVMCGDSTMIDDVDKLMNGEIPCFVHTDPPYGMNAVSKSGVLSKNYDSDILGDDNTDVAKNAFTLIYNMYPKAKHIWWGANYYCSSLPDSENWIVWDKNNGGADQADCELAWGNFRTVVRMFKQSSEKKDRVHPTQKPVSLIDWFLESKRFKLEPKLIADFFGGSGSTLISSDKNRIPCRVMEFDPKYCDVIINRWQNYTGKKAVLESTGEEYGRDTL
jgi:DNA modification methylase